MVESEAPLKPKGPERGEAGSDVSLFDVSNDDDDEASIFETEPEDFDDFVEDEASSDEEDELDDEDSDEAAVDSEDEVFDESLSSDVEPAASRDAPTEANEDA